MKSKQAYNQKSIADSELILNQDGSLYHLHIKGEQIADTVLLVGDQNRVKKISDKFDSIEIKISSREFITHTGHLNGVRLTVISTGIGVDNIDIVINEIDAAVNIDLKNKKSKEAFRQINFIRLGTSGAMQEDIPIGSMVASKYAFGFDGVAWFYTPDFNKNELELMNKFENELTWNKNTARPYFVEADDELFNRLTHDMIAGITATANGFYGPQGRMLRLPLNNPKLEEQLRSFTWNAYRVTNFEMEAAGLYALGSMLGHRVLTVCVILANRYRKEFSKDASEEINNLIDKVLARLTN